HSARSSSPVMPRSVSLFPGAAHMTPGRSISRSNTMPRLNRDVPFIRPGTKKAPTATTLPVLRAKTPSGRFLEFCRRFLVHVKGPKTGQPLVLARWQVERIVKPLFDTRLPDGRRQYRACYLTCPRKQGKSTLGAAIALYLLYADGEGGAEIVSAASSADQAAIIYDTAKSMVDGVVDDPQLASILVVKCGRRPVAAAHQLTTISP